MLRTLTIITWVAVGLLFLYVLPDLVKVNWAEIFTQATADRLLADRRVQIGGLIAAGAVMLVITLAFLKDSQPDLGSLLTLLLVFGLPIASLLQIYATQGSSPELTMVMLALMASQAAALVMFFTSKIAESSKTMPEWRHTVGGETELPAGKG